MTSAVEREAGAVSVPSTVPAEGDRRRVEDAAAVVLAFSMLPVFVLTKLALIRHFTVVNLLTVSGVRRALLPTLFGSDLLLCGALAILYLAVFRASQLLGRTAGWARWVPIGAVHLVLVGVEVVDLKVHGRYGKPLTFYLTAMMGDLRVFSDLAGSDHDCGLRLDAAARRHVRPEDQPGCLSRGVLLAVALAPRHLGTCGA